METYVLARVIHVLCVILWIGGVAMVTMSILPAIRRMEEREDPFELFERIERRFAWQSRITTALTGLSGFYMLYYIDGWSRSARLDFWWINAMMLVWFLFTVILFVLEPLFLHRVLRERARRDFPGTLARVQAMHWVLLILSLVTVAGTVAGSHGWFWI